MVEEGVAGRSEGGLDGATGVVALDLEMAVVGRSWREGAEVEIKQTQPVSGTSKQHELQL